MITNTDILQLDCRAKVFFLICSVTHFPVSAEVGGMPYLCAENSAAIFPKL